jgi:hypothetical protein
VNKKHSHPLPHALFIRRTKEQNRKKEAVLLLFEFVKQQPKGYKEDFG